MLTSDSLDRRIHKLHVRSQLAKRPVSGCGLVTALSAGLVLEVLMQTNPSETNPLDHSMKL